MSSTRVTPCWGCVQRRLVCDCTRPTCLKCEARGIECPGYGPKPLKWMQPGQTRAKGARAGARLGTTDWRLVFSGESGDKSPQSDTNSTKRLKSVHVPSEQSLSNNSDFECLVWALEYSNSNVIADIVCTGVRGETNPFFFPVENAASMSPGLTHIIICAALGHRIMQFKEKDSHEERDVMMTMLEKHRGEAIRHVSEEIANCRVDSCGTVICLLLTELQHSMSSDWLCHIDGAYAIIEMGGGLMHLVRSQPSLRHLCQLLVSISILGSTTSPAPTLERTNRQLELLECLEELFAEGVMMCIICPPTVLKEIIHINFRRALIHQQSIEGGEVDENADEPVETNILDRIMKFSTEIWASDVSKRARDEIDGHHGEGEAGLSAAEWDWGRIGRIYQTAAALYCIASLFKSAEDNKAAANSRLRATLRRTLLQDLQETAVDSNSQLRKLVFWPLAVLGLELDHDDTASQQFITDELEWFSSALGTASPLVAKSLLETVWTGERGTQWNALFDQPYVFTM